MEDNTATREHKPAPHAKPRMSFTGRMMREGNQTGGYILWFHLDDAPAQAKLIVGDGSQGRA